jgi:RNA polymerase sigma factor (sigma-70 family)
MSTGDEPAVELATDRRSSHLLGGAAAQGGEHARSDASLVAAVRREPPDAEALDALVRRYWRLLFARCQVLTGDREAARDLAQESWLRVLRARHLLDPDGNFPGYLVTVATNLWRDRNRAARRAGPLADARLASLDVAVANDGDAVLLGDAVPDLHAMPVEQQTMLVLDVDRALARLTPRARDVLTSRFLDEESCAEIGRRYGRTEQTVSAWVRAAILEMRHHLGEPPGA